MLKLDEMFAILPTDAAKRLEALMAKANLLSTINDGSNKQNPYALTVTAGNPYNASESNPWKVRLSRGRHYFEGEGSSLRGAVMALCDDINNDYLRAVNNNVVALDQTRQESERLAADLAKLREVE